jgi:TPR repeat protein
MPRPLSGSPKPPARAYFRRCSSWQAGSCGPEHGRNVDDAIAWLKKAADKGDATAEVELGDIFVDPKLGRVDY